MVENWCPSNLFNIARGTGLPLKIGPKTRNLENGMFARVLGDVDMVFYLLETILVNRKVLNFFVSISYERLPSLCVGCGIIGHDINNCRKEKGEEFQSGGFVRRADNLQQTNKENHKGVIQQHKDTTMGHNVRKSASVGNQIQVCIPTS